MELADRLDSARFVGRHPELARLTELIDRPSGAIALVHGPGGIGKSALLRQAGRLARAAGRPVVSLDLRDAVPVPAVLEPAAAAAELDRPVVLLDTFEHVAALTDHLRSQVLPQLPPGALVMIGSRLPPEPAWRAGPLSAVIETLELAPLNVRDSRQLLRSLGLDDPQRIDAALHWTGGSPLGLALAAEHQTTGDRPPESVASELVARLLDEPYDADRSQLGALVLASILRVTTPAVLARVLPDADPAEVWDWLSKRAFMSRAGAGLAPHELVATALRALVRVQSPALERELRRRAIDVLVADAQAGGPTGVADLTVLVDNAMIRWGFGVNGRTHYLDAVRPGDADVLLDESNPRLRPNIGRLRRWLDARPCPVFVVRDEQRAVVGVALAFSTATAAPEAWTDDDVGRFLRHAAEHVNGDAVIWLCSETVDDDPAGRVQGLLGVGGYVFTHTPNPAGSYIPITPDQPEAVDFARESGAVHAPELDTVLSDGSPLHTYVLGDGRGGVFERIHRTVYAELGLPWTSPTGGTAEPAGESALGNVRAALRVFGRDGELARTALAGRLLPAGGTNAARAKALRALLRDAVADAMPDPQADERQVLEQTYFGAAGTVHVSRSTRYRLLRRGIEALAESLAQRQPASAPDRVRPTRASTHQPPASTSPPAK